MKRRYKVRVSVADGTEETQFIPLADSTPRIRTRYVRDPARHGKYRDSVEYSIDPERVDDPAEEALASEDPAVEQQRAEEKAAEKKVKKGRKGSRKAKTALVVGERGPELIKFDGEK
jgi:hypothetical protein